MLALDYIDKKLFHAENLSDSEDEIFLTENIKKKYEIEAESRKSRCSSQMKLVKNKLLLNKQKKILILLDKNTFLLHNKHHVYSLLYQILII